MHVINYTIFFESVVRKVGKKEIHYKRMKRVIRAGLQKTRGGTKKQVLTKRKYGAEIKQTTVQIRKVTNSIRNIVAYNYDYKCAGCEIKLPPTWECDHIIPLWKIIQQPNLVKGDPNQLSNLQPLCPNCHRLKTMHENIERDQSSRKFMECPICQTRYSPYFPDHKCGNL